MYYIVFSNKDEASKNIAYFIKEELDATLEKLYENFSIYNSKKENVKLVEVFEDMLKADFLNNNLPYCECVIFLSKHVSSKKIKSFTVHVTGNWNKNNEFGGEKEKVSIAFPSLMCELLKEIYVSNNFREFQVSLEVTHHGPTLDYPVIFYEIGSSKEEWNNEKYCEFMADILLKFIKKDFKIKKKKIDICFGIGGNHYATYFTRKVLDEEIYVGHIIPTYAFTNDLNIDKAISMGIERSIEKVNKVYFQKKAVPSEHRKKIVEILERYRSLYNVDIYISK